MIWMYAICDRPELPPPRRRGLAQAPLDGLCEGPLLAVFTRHGYSVGAPAPDALWAHERVVERLMTDRSVLPVRFGSTFDDEDGVRRLLIDRQSWLLDLLERVRGRVELGVRVVQTVPEHSPAVVSLGGGPTRTGRDYLYEKLQNGRRAAQVSSDIDVPLTGLAVERRQQPPYGTDEVLRASYLVERGTVARFRGAVEALQRTHPELGILCTGPWPPYSFVGGR
jgi:hypothetical protein